MFLKRFKSSIDKFFFIALDFYLGLEKLCKFNVEKFNEKEVHFESLSSFSFLSV